MKHYDFVLPESVSEEDLDLHEKDLRELREARKVRPRSASDLLLWVGWLEKRGKRKFFSYQQLADTLADARGPHVTRLQLRRFIEKNLPQVFEFRSQFEFNRNVPVAKESKND